MLRTKPLRLRACSLSAPPGAEHLWRLLGHVLHHLVTGRAHRRGVHEQHTEPWSRNAASVVAASSGVHAAAEQYAQVPRPARRRPEAGIRDAGRRDHGRIEVAEDSRRPPGRHMRRLLVARPRLSTRRKGPGRCPLHPLPFGFVRPTGHDNRRFALHRKRHNRRRPSATRRPDCSVHRAVVLMYPGLSGNLCDALRRRRDAQVQRPLVFRVPIDRPADRCGRKGHLATRRVPSDRNAHRALLHVYSGLCGSLSSTSWRRRSA
mmetsp:Transcript_21058/g.58842  ORF Transcript_21058/g.58842 Transcript_21058/m.58842 type:complete len:262 (+) Transcript_21058:407-1192(+)